MRTAISVGSDAVLGGYEFDPLNIPFLPDWPAGPVVVPRFAGSIGLVSVVDGHSNTEKEMKCPTRSMKDLTRCL